MLNQNNVAKELGCSVDTVRQNLRDYNIDSHTTGSWNQSNIIVLNDEQKEVEGKFCMMILGNMIESLLLIKRLKKCQIEKIWMTENDFG